MLCACICLCVFVCVLSCKSSWIDQFVTCFICKAQRLTRIDKMKGYVCMYARGLLCRLHMCDRCKMSQH